MVYKFITNISEGQVTVGYHILWPRLKVTRVLEIQRTVTRNPLSQVMVSNCQYRLNIHYNVLKPFTLNINNNNNNKTFDSYDVSGCRCSIFHLFLLWLVTNHHQTSRKWSRLGYLFNKVSCKALYGNAQYHAALCACQVSSSSFYFK